MFEPNGIEGGTNASKGANIYTYPCGRQVNIGGKSTFEAVPGSVFTIKTPGGGGYGKVEDRKTGLKEDEESNTLISGSLNSFKKQ